MLLRIVKTLKVTTVRIEKQRRNEETKKIHRSLNQEKKNKEKYERRNKWKMYSNQNGMHITYSWINEWAEFSIRKAAKKSNCTTFRRNKPKTNKKKG